MVITSRRHKQGFCWVVLKLSDCVQVNLLAKSWSCSKCATPMAWETVTMTGIENQDRYQWRCPREQTTDSFELLLSRSRSRYAWHHVFIRKYHWALSTLVCKNGTSLNWIWNCHVEIIVGKNKSQLIAMILYLSICHDAREPQKLGRWFTLFFFYKNLVYKNIKASNGPKIKNILRTYEGFKSWEKNFA